MLLVKRNYQPLMSELVEQFFGNDYLNKMERTFNTYSPKANIQEFDKHYAIEMLVPGFEKQDFKLEMEENILKVSAHHTESNEQNTEENGSKMLHREFGEMSIERSFRMTKEIDSSAISANYNNGVLTITLPKSEEVVLKRMIEVK